MTGLQLIYSIVILFAVSTFNIRYIKEKLDLIIHMNIFLMKNGKFLKITTLIILLTGCSLPMNEAQKQAQASADLKENSAYWLHGKNFNTQLEQNLTAYLALDDAFLSIASRLHIINKAKHSIDLQYYIWENDSIGQLLLSELLKAADRGVKVRLLIDDQNGIQLDSTLKQLAQHPNFEIKLFNPYKFRKLRAIDYLFRFKNVNHRMHNKLIIGDGVIAVTGGRNISREYFDASDQFQFTDLDIMFYGPSVLQANQVFSTFWNDDLSYSVKQLLGAGSAEALKELRDKYELDDLRKTQQEQKVYNAEKVIRDTLKSSAIHWAKAHFLADSPNKIRANAAEQELIHTQIFKIMGQPKQHMDLVSAYFVPQKKGLKYLQSIQSQNVTTRVLTNSYLANDVPVVHAFYQKYRKDLLQSGVQLYEFKPYIERTKRTWYEVATGNVIPAKNKNASRLHAKFFDIDGMVFIGSFNFDPRSAYLNTEVGLVVESQDLENEISQTLNEYLPVIAYELKLDEKGNLIWLDHKFDGSTVIHKTEPETTKFQRFAFKAVSYLPIEWMM